MSWIIWEAAESIRCADLRRFCCAAVLLPARDIDKCVSAGTGWQLAPLASIAIVPTWSFNCLLYYMYSECRAFPHAAKAEEQSLSCSSSKRRLKLHEARSTAGSEKNHPRGRNRKLFDSVARQRKVGNLTVKLSSDCSALTSA